MIYLKIDLLSLTLNKDFARLAMHVDNEGPLTIAPMVVRGSILIDFLLRLKPDEITIHSEQLENDLLERLFKLKLDGIKVVDV